MFWESGLARRARVRFLQPLFCAARQRSAGRLRVQSLRRRWHALTRAEPGSSPCAGRTPTPARRDAAPWAHPRARGRTWFRRCWRRGLGSSPRAGGPDMVRNSTLRRGFIPARAGWRPTAGRSGRRAQVHPRLRGAARFLPTDRDLSHRPDSVYPRASGVDLGSAATPAFSPPSPRWRSASDASSSSTLALVLSVRAIHGRPVAV